MGFKKLAFRLLPLMYFLAVSLPHHPFSTWLDDVFIEPVGYYPVQHIADIASWVLLGVSAALLIRIAYIHRWRALKHISILLLLVALMYATDYYLIVNNIERVHYPQYAMLALLLGLSLRNEMLIFFATTFAGFVDEFLQYFMNPMKSNYLDFNDIVLNILGAAAGVVLLMGLRKRLAARELDLDLSGPARYEQIFAAMFRTVMVAGAVVVFVAGLFGRIVPLVEQAKDRSVFAVVNGKISFIMSFERHDEFWMKSYFGKVFHVLSPVEGLVSIAVLALGIWGSVSWLRIRSREPNA